MDILSLSRSDMERWHSNLNHIKIVIHDRDLPKPDVICDEKCKGILFLSCDDISYESSVDQPFSEDDAKKVADFIAKNHEDIRHIVVSCEQGISRSAGVAAALEEHFYEKESFLFYDFIKEPNKLVYRKMKEALKQQFGHTYEPSEEEKQDWLAHFDPAEKEKAQKEVQRMLEKFLAEMNRNLEN